MADTVTLKRIIDLVTQADVDSGVYTIIDSTTDAVKKYPIGAFINSVAPVFDATAAYTAGQYCNYNGQIYKFTADHAAGDWTGSDAEAATLVEALEDLEEIPAEITSILADLDEKADKDGDYDYLTAGLAEQLLSDVEVVDQIPYFLRPSGGNGADREYDQIVGASCIWNQLVNTGDTSVTVTSGHKYYSNINGTKTIGASDGTAISINDASEDNVVDLTALFGSATIADYLYTLEQSTPGAGIAKLREWGFLKDEYIPYSAPDLQSVSGVSAHVMVGFNQMNPESYILDDSSTNYNVSIGSKLSAGGNGATITGGNPIKVDITTNWRGATFVSEKLLPDTNYYFIAQVSAPTSGNLRLSLYLIKDDYTVVSNKGNYTANQTFAITINTAQEGLRVALTVDSTSHQIVTVENLCLNISNPSLNGQYKPYQKTTYPLDSDLTLRGKFRLDDSNNLYADGDIYYADGAIEINRRTIDLSTLNWTTKKTGTTKKALMADLPAQYASDTMLQTWVCDTYDFVGSTSTTFINNNDVDEMGIGIYKYSTITTSDVTIYLVIPVGSSPSGTLIYKLSTPTTESADPYQNPQLVDPDGTEEYVSTGVVPVGHVTRYPANLRQQVENLLGVPKPPSTAGTYKLQATVTSSGVSYAWVSDT